MDDREKFEKANVSNCGILELIKKCIRKDSNKRPVIFEIVNEIKQVINIKDNQYDIKSEDIINIDDIPKRNLLKTDYNDKKTISIEFKEKSNENIH